MAHVGSELNTSFVNWAFPGREGQKPLSPISAVCIQTSCPKSTRTYVRSSYFSEGTLQGPQLHCCVGAQPRPLRLADWKARPRQAGCRLWLSCLVMEAKKCPTGWVLPLRSRKRRENRPAHTPKSNGVFRDGQIWTTGRELQRDRPSTCLLSKKVLILLFKEHHSRKKQDEDRETTRNACVGMRYTAVKNSKGENCIIVHVK